MKYKIGDVISNGKVFFRYDGENKFTPCSENGVARDKTAKEWIKLLSTEQTSSFNLYTANLTVRNKNEVREVKEFFDKTIISKK